MKLDLVPCPSCDGSGCVLANDGDYENPYVRCNECLGEGCIPIDRDLELPPSEPLGVPANFDSYGYLEDLLDWIENNPRPEASDPRDYWEAESIASGFEPDCCS